VRLWLKTELAKPGVVGSVSEVKSSTQDEVVCASPGREGYALVVAAGTDTRSAMAIIIASTTPRALPIT
jgi:hypothetical protein